MSHHQRRISTPGISRKRKEREPFYSFKPSIPVQSSVYSGPKLPSSPDCSNQLLAGYMAHEFLTKGTLLGQQFDPARSEAVRCLDRENPSSRKPDRRILRKRAEVMLTWREF
ncbi:uncharacterized protein LOC120213664 [Hibiscus syriacus]|uniref:uncharacterized protein LOC120213664 n=1 Tax=Hibiscus syriacus TaxID=106335 RepID=UPI0019247601|nr:uncharacterized protein LOC120213664 [Hibiscus syriacus]